jgi:CRP/FNR family transcriptional regulator, dissimilatory nitrate respiration regulator
MDIKEGHTSQFITSIPFFKELDEKVLEILLNAAIVKTYSKNTSLFIQGDAADRFFIILSGWVKLYRNTAEGDEAIVALFTRGDVFGEAAIFGSAGYPFSAEAVEETRVIEIPASLIRERAQADLSILERVMKSMSREMHNLQLESEHMALMNAPQRVGCLLLQLSSGMIGKGGTFSFPYDKSLAAQRLGMKPETFSRALAQLKPIGVMVKGPEITIDNFSVLAGYCCGHCSAEIENCKGATRKPCEPSRANTKTTVKSEN